MYLHPQKYNPCTCKSADANANADADTDYNSYVLYNPSSVICGCGCRPVYFSHKCTSCTSIQHTSIYIYISISSK